MYKKKLVNFHRMIRTFFYFSILFLSIHLNCCFIPKNQVDTSFHSYHIKTNVDSSITKYYLENFLHGKQNNPSFDLFINDINNTYKNPLPSREDLQEISKKTSVDFSAVFFANKLLNYKNNDKLQIDFLKNLEIVKNEKLFYQKDDYLILLVPGFDYAENGSVTGADFAKPRELLSKTGLNVHFVNIDPIGSVEENARFITDTIQKFPNKKILIAGASSAGPAIHLSLGKYLDKTETKRIKAWLNLGGILQGSPLLDQFSSGFKGFLFDSIIWIKSWRKASFESMQTDISRTRFKENEVPESIYILNYLGMSLSGDISKFASDKYCLMRKDGPNDGLSLLPDLLAPNSHSILSPKSDHFFAEDPEINLKTLALLKTILETVDR